MFETANSLVAQRKCYGSQNKKAVIPEDTAPEGIWRWEVQLMDLLPADKVNIGVLPAVVDTYVGSRYCVRGEKGWLSLFLFVGGRP